MAAVYVAMHTITFVQRRIALRGNSSSDNIIVELVPTSRCCQARARVFTEWVEVQTPYHQPDIVQGTDDDAITDKMQAVEGLESVHYGHLV